MHKLYAIEIQVFFIQAPKLGPNSKCLMEMTVDLLIQHQ
jgi:hypothetical protein